MQSLCVCDCIYNPYDDVAIALVWGLVNNYLSECLFVRIFVHHSAAGALGDVVVKALRYKPEGRGFDSRWCHWNFSVKHGDLQKIIKDGWKLRRWMV